MIDAMIRLEQALRPHLDGLPPTDSLKRGTDDETVSGLDED
jgi:hypothetical protein